MAGDADAGHAHGGRRAVRRAKQMNELIENIDKLHTTEMGAERIKRNCRIETEDVVEWSKAQILDKTVRIERIGKNWYAVTGSYKITVNTNSYTIITAHKTKA